ncbi:MAG: helix-turn-helix domain-containing protein [Isosphaeraceae bacterium]
MNGTNAPSVNGQVVARLTPEESARKFDIMDGIDAIPVDEMFMRLKPLARHLVSHASYGQGMCYTSHETLSKELGSCSKTIQRGLAELTSQGWFVCAGRVVGRSDNRRHSDNKHAIPQYAVGKRLVDWLRSYFAVKDKRKRKRGVGQQMSNPIRST